MRLRLKGALRFMSVESLSTGIEASASGESLNSGDPVVHPAASDKLQQLLRRAGRGLLLLLLLLQLLRRAGQGLLLELQLQLLRRAGRGLLEGLLLRRA